MMVLARTAKIAALATMIITFSVFITGVQAQKTVEALPSDFFLQAPGTSVSAYGHHACALQSLPGVEFGGRAVCWGETFFDSNLQPPNDQLFIQVMTTDTFSCGLTIDERVVCWGEISITEIPGLYSQIAGSMHYACGVMTDGNLNCWGDVNFIPMLPEKGSHKFVQVSCSETIICALDIYGHIECWDRKGRGNAYLPQHLRPPMFESHPRLDGEEDENEDENEEDDEEKIDVPVEMEKILFKQIATSNYLICGIRYTDEALHCWGSNHHVSKPLKEHLVKVGPYRQVANGEMGMCAILAETGALDCIGDAYHMIRNAGMYFEDWDQIFVGAYTICGITVDSKTSCFGGLPSTNNVPVDLDVA